MPKLITADPAAVIGTPNASGAAFGAGVGAARNALGDSFGALGKVMAEYASSKSRAAAAQYKQDLSEKVAEINANPNVEERPKQFQDAQRELFKTHRPTWANGMPHEYDAEAGFAGQSLRIGLVDQMRQDAMQQTRDNDKIEFGQIAASIAHAKTDVDANLGIASGVALLARRESAGFYSTAQATTLWQGTLHDAIDLTTETNPERAGRLLEAHKDFLSADQQVGLRAKVQGETTLLNAQAVEDAAFAALPSGSSLPAYEGFIRSHASGKEREIALSNAGARWSSNDRAVTEYRTNAASGIISEMYTAHNAGIPPSQITEIGNQFMRKAIAAGLEGGQLNAVASTWDSLTKQGAVRTDWGYFDEVFTDPSKVGTPGYTAPEMAARMAPGEMSKALDLSRSARMGSLPEQGTVNRTISDELDSYGIQDKEDRGKLRGQIQTDMQAVNPKDRADVLKTIRARLNPSQGSHFGPQGDVDMTSAAIIDSQRDADPTLVRLAVWDASGAGRHLADEDQVASNILARQDEVQRFRETHTSAETTAYLARLADEGARRAHSLTRDGYPDVEILDYEDQYQESVHTLNAIERERQARENAPPPVQVQTHRPPALPGLRSVDEWVQP